MLHLVSHPTAHRYGCHYLTQRPHWGEMANARTMNELPDFPLDISELGLAQSSLL